MYVCMFMFCQSEIGSTAITNNDANLILNINQINASVTQQTAYKTAISEIRIRSQAKRVPCRQERLFVNVNLLYCKNYLSDIILSKKKVVCFSIKCHVLYSGCENFESSYIILRASLIHPIPISYLLLSILNSFLYCVSIHACIY